MAQNNAQSAAPKDSTPARAPTSDAEVKGYYNIEKRGSVSPDYTLIEATYRSQRLMELNNSYVIREQPLMELNNVPYSQYDLVNFQCDLAYNPPKVNPGDSRIVSGYVREKDQTIVSVIMDMNFQPAVTPFDKNNKELVNFCNIATAKIKKVLLQSNFKDEMENMARLMVSRGNVFVDIKKQEKWKVKKIRTSGQFVGPLANQKITWNTIYEKVCDYCSIDTLPNTSVFPMNIKGPGMKDQSRIYTVRHYPIAQLAQVFSKNPRWNAVPKTYTQTIPNTQPNGIWGDYYLKIPVKDYGELIVMQSEVYNEYNCWVNGVQMYPVQFEAGTISGYPLSEISPTGSFTICKGDYERIPFFFFSKSNPDKNFVKEEELNEVMRLMVLMLRQKTQPPIGNNSDKVLQSNMWEPNMIISDLKKDDISILNPNDGIGNAEFSFWKMLQDSIDDTSVSKSIEGSEDGSMTLGQYQDQKKESLKKLGLCLDRVIDLLKQIYLNILDNEIAYIDQKIKTYKEDGSFVEAYNSFSVEDTVDGKKANIKVNLTDNPSAIDKYAEAKKEADASGMNRSYHAKPEVLKDIYRRMRDQVYMNVVAAPEGEQVALLGMLFNLLIQYTNLKGDSKKINFDYIETIIAENSGFDSNKLFLDEPLEPAPVPGAVPSPFAAALQTGGQGGKLPQNINPAPNGSGFMKR